MIPDILLRIKALFRRGRIEQELDDELSFHLEKQTEAHVRAGMDRAAAERRARLELGGVERTKEEYREALGVGLIDHLRRDLRTAARSLRATPVATAAAVLSLALAIGANSAVFSIIDGLILRTLPVDHPERLVLVTDEASSPRARVWNAPIWGEIQRRPDLFERVAAWSFTRFDLADGGEAQPVEGLWVSGTFFETLGLDAILGRTLAPRDDVRGGGAEGPVAVVSHAYWQSELGGRAEVIGSAVRLSGVTFTIVGVVEPGFTGPEVGRSFDFMAPLATEPLVTGEDSALDSCCTNYLTVIGRLMPGQSEERAAVALRDAQAGLREAALAGSTETPSPEAAARYLASPLGVVAAATGFSNLRLKYARPIWVIGVVVALVLAIACVNVANLLTVRSIARRHELSARMALGASRAQLVRQLLTEGFVLSAAAAVLGILIAGASARFLVRQLSTPTNPVFLDVSLGWRALAFTAGVALLTTLFFGAAPALRLGRIQPIEALAGAGRTTPSRAHTSLTEGLIVLQVALSLMLVAGAGVFVRSFTGLRQRPLGIEADPVLVAALDAEPIDSSSSQRLALMERLVEAVRGMPSVSAAAISDRTPLGSGGFTPSVEILAASGGSAAELIPPDMDVFGSRVSPGWFDVFGMRLLAGRDFTPTDRAGAPPVAVVNEHFVRRFLAGGSPLGRRFTVYPNTPRATTFEVVGVAADAVYSNPRNPVPATWFAPMAQFEEIGFSFTSARLSVRTASGPPLAFADDVSRAAVAIHPRFSVTFSALSDQLRASLTQERLLAQVAAFFGGTALLLAALGLYGLSAFAVSRRRAEIGVRTALGGARRRIVGSMIARMTLVVGCGVAVGLVATAWAARFVTTLVHGVPTRDPATLLGAALALLVTGTFAAWIPAHSAVRGDASRALRSG